MTLAQVQAAVALITFLIATWAGLIIAVALLLPKQASDAQRTLSRSPVRSFFIGLAMLIPTVLGVTMLRSPIGSVKLLGFALLVYIGAALAIGASGVAMLMGQRIREMTDSRSDFAGLVRGSIVFSLALGFPLIGWFVFLPVSLVLSLGLGARAIRRSSAAVLPPVNPSGPEYDVVRSQGAV